jgi:hypothetical protein
MQESEPSLHRRALYAGARTIAWFTAIATAYGTVRLVIRAPPDMDSGLRWGMVGLFVLLFCVSVMMLFAKETRRR